MCQRPNCMYVHPPLMKMMNQVQGQGRGKPSFPFQKNGKTRDFAPSAPEGGQN